MRRSETGRNGGEVADRANAEESILQQQNSGDGKKRAAVASDAKNAVKRDTPFTLIYATPKETRVRFELGEWSLEEIELANGKRATLVVASSGGRLSEKGAPALPVYRCDFAVPATGYTIAECNCVTREVKCAPHAASAGMLLASEAESEPQFIALDEKYQDGIWPEQRSRTLARYSLRGAAGQGIAYAPFQYDATRGIMLVTEAAELVLRADEAEASDYSTQSGEPGFAQLQASLFCNSELLRSAVEDNFPHILVIVPDGWSSATESFVDWKRSIGNNVVLAEYPGETGSDLAEYLRNAYGNGTTHIVLCGDSGDIPPAYTAANVDTPGSGEPTSDIRYVLVDGDDFFADMFISRLPAKSSEQLQKMMSKLVSYEQNGVGDSWRAMSVSIASSSYKSFEPYRKQSDTFLVQSFRQELIDNADFSEEGAEFYAAQSPTSAQVASALNSGASFMMYLGHGQVNYIEVTQFNTGQARILSNGEALPFCLLPVCLCGNFAHTTKDCLAEGFFKTSNADSNGAAAVFASTNDTYWTPPIRNMETIVDYMQLAHSAEALTDFGAYCWAGVQAGAALADAEESCGKQSTGLYHVKQMHLFGDCSAMARIVPLAEAHIEKFYLDGEVLNIEVKSSEDEGVSGAYVIISQGENRLCCRTGSDGTAKLGAEKLESGTVELQVYGAAIQNIRENREIGVVKYELGSYFCGVEISFDLQKIVGCSIEACSELPAGLTLSEDGILSGAMTESGRYSIICTCENNEKYLFKIEAYETPDKDGNGVLTHTELLSYINGLEEEGEQFVQAVDWWQRGEAESTRAAASAETATLVDDVSYSDADWLISLKNEGTLEQWSRLQQLGADICSGDGEHLYLYVSQAVLAKIEREYEVLSCVELETSATRGDIYPAYDEVLAKIKELCNVGGDRVNVSYIGTTPGGLETLALRITDLDEEAAEGAPQLLIAGGIHGNERPTTVCALALAEALASGDALLNKAVFWIVPVMNPDGYGTSRYNSNHIDLNRSYPDGVVISDLGMFGSADEMRLAGRQQETADFMRWCAQHNFSAALHLHTGDTLICYPYGNYSGSASSAIAPDDALFKRLAQAYADGCGYISTIINASAYYTVTGECADWQYRYLGILPLTVELTGQNASGKEPSSSETLKALAQSNVNGMLAWAAAACTGVSVQVSCEKEALPNGWLVVGDGMPIYSTPYGTIFRTAIPGNQSLSVGASGYKAKSNINVSIEEGEINHLSEKVLSCEESTMANMFFDNRWSLPLHKNGVTISANSQQLGKYGVLTVSLPASAESDIAAAKCERQENDGAVSYLLAAADSYAVQVTPGENLSVEPLISVILTTEDRSCSMLANWVPAPRRDRTLLLKSGWNLVGFGDAPEETQLLQKLQLWSYGDGIFRPASSIEPGKALFAYAQSQMQIELVSWQPELFLEKGAGWSIKALPYSKIVEDAYMQQEHIYIKQPSIPENTGFWYYGRQ